MFGLKAFLNALARLTASINRSADIFDAANTHLEQQLACDRAEPLGLEHDLETPAANGAGKRRKATV